MVEGLAKGIAALIAALLLLAGAPALAGSTFAPGSTCFAADSDKIGYGALSSNPGRWTCDRAEWSIAADRVILRMDLADGATAGADTLTMRTTRFESMVLTAQNARGQTARATYRPDDLTLETFDWLMSAPIPKLAGTPKVVWVEIEKARDLYMLADAQLVRKGELHARLGDLELVVAVLCGILIIPFIYNLAFYRVLRERFLLWHAAVVASLLVHIAVSSGLINHIFRLTVTQASTISVTSWSIGTIAAGLFMVNLVEADKLDRWHARAMVGLAALVASCNILYIFGDGALRPLSTPVFVSSFYPVLMLFALMMVTALRRGSRAIRFLIIAWLPLMAVGTYRAITNLGISGSTLDVMMAQHMAIVFEVVVTSLGVADRFMTIKRQHDRALAMTRALEQEVEHDELTGLHNRRAIRLRFDALFEGGFDTMALIDLDHFKQINDTRGHAVGDEVLRQVASALMPDDDTIAVRMGGEEFMLLLRGANAVARAEHRRRAITARIAALMPGLGSPVTASMGLVNQPRNSSANSDYGLLYAHCDRLLYEAKRAGRNRTMSERIMRFGEAEQSIDPTGTGLRAVS